MPTSDLPLYKSSDCSHLDLKERASRSETATRVAVGISTAMTVGTTACPRQRQVRLRVMFGYDPSRCPAPLNLSSVEDAGFELSTEDVNAFRAECEVNGMMGKKHATVFICTKPATHEVHFLREPTWTWSLLRSDLGVRPFLPPNSHSIADAE